MLVFLFTFIYHFDTLVGVPRREFIVVYVLNEIHALVAADAIWEVNAVRLVPPQPDVL